MARLMETYKTQIAPALAAKIGRSNPNSLPKLEKIVLSMGFGRAATAGEKQKIDDCVKQLGQISGQKAATTLSRVSVSGFKLREGMKVGAKVTLRGKRMYEFLDRLVSIALPRVRDFRGLSSKGFDGHGNYNLGIVEQSVFPEVDTDKVQFTQGLNVAIVVKNATDKESHDLLEAFGVPFRKPTEAKAPQQPQPTATA